MPLPKNVRPFPSPSPQYWREKPHGLEVFATMTARCVAVVLIALFAFTLGIMARSMMDIPRFALMQKSVFETEQVCRDIAYGAEMSRKGK